jgi:hypothetical protein
MCRRETTGGAFDGLSADSNRHVSNSFAGAATLLHLLQPDKFEYDIAAAACVAFADPFMEFAEAEPGSHGSSLLAAFGVHQVMAIMHLERLHAALAVPGFPAAVAAEDPAALAALATACIKSTPDSALAAFAPAALEVITGQRRSILGATPCTAHVGLLQSAQHKQICTTGQNSSRSMLVVYSNGLLGGHMIVLLLWVRRLQHTYVSCQSCVLSGSCSTFRWQQS